MRKIFHINKYGVPATCNSPRLCPYGKERHFESYEAAKFHLESESRWDINELSHPSKLIESYYYSQSAINEFPINKKTADLEDFDLIAVSWLMRSEVKEGMKSNRIANVKFTYGDIVRIINEKVKEQFNGSLHIDKYNNPSHRDSWDAQMKAQYNLYKNKENEIAEKLNLESAEIMVFSMDARVRLQSDGYMMSPSNIHEVVYKVKPSISLFGNMISYNHSTGETSKEFDIYEVAGVIEGQTLHELCYSDSYERQFERLWRIDQQKTSKLNYDYAARRFKEEQFMKGLEGTDIPKAFVRMSPVVAQELTRFVRTYKAMMCEIRDLLVENELEFIGHYQDDDGEWIVD